jgi:uncharacterized delta-60 repeat protein
MARTPHGRRLHRYTFRPRVEALEDRNLMTAGALDPTVGTAGLVTTGVLPTIDGANAMVLQSDGRVVLAGDYLRAGVGVTGFSIVRLNTDGSLDRSFGVSGGAVIDIGGNDGSAQAVSLQRDGKIVVAGYAAVGVGTASTTDFAVGRLNRDGTLDTTFGTGGEQTISFGADQAAYGQSVVVQPDGKIVVAGYTSSLGTPSSAFAIARLNPDGSIDTTFGVGGKQSLSFATPYAVATSLALQSDGKIVVAGNAQQATLISAYAVVRLNPDGSPDRTFGTGGEQMLTFAGTVHDTAAAVLVQPGGKIILAGQAEFGTPYVGSASEAGIARLNGDGSLDRSFGTGGEALFTFGMPSGAGDFEMASSLALEADGKLVVAGDAYQPNARTAEFGLARLNPDGSFDATFAGGGRITTSFGEEAFARSVALTPDGKIVVAGGWYPQVGSQATTLTTQWAISRYAGDGSSFSYDQVSKTLTVAATTFVFSQSSSADAAGVHTTDTFTANGVTLHIARTLVSSVVVNGGGTGTASLTTNDTYIGTDGQTHETVESIVLGNGKGKLYQGGVLPFIQLTGFTTIDAYLGHADSAALRATPGVANVFITTPSYSDMSDPGSYYLVRGAHSVYGYAVGPADHAYEYGGSGPTTFVATGTTFSSLTGTDHGIAYYNEAVGFTWNYAIATPGSQNTAYFTAATSGDRFVGRTGYSYLYHLNPNGTYAELDYAQGFTRVFATAPAGATDYAYLYDTTVNHATGFKRLD